MVRNSQPTSNMDVVFLRLKIVLNQVEDGFNLAWINFVINK